MENFLGLYSILYVEDDLILSSKLSNVLKDLFKEVVCAHSGIEGLEMYEEYFQQNNKYVDIVITDINMPKMNGLDLSGKIKQINQDQIIIVLSAHNDDHIDQRIKELGIKYQLVKPISLDKLLQMIGLIHEELRNPQC